MRRPEAQIVDQQRRLPALPPSCGIARIERAVRARVLVNAIRLADDDAARLRAAAVEERARLGDRHPVGMPEVIGRSALDGSGRSRRIRAGSSQETHAPRNAEEPDRGGDRDPHIDSGEDLAREAPDGLHEPLDLRPCGEADRSGKSEERCDDGEAPGDIRPLRQDGACEEQERSGELRGGPRRPGERLRPRPCGQDWTRSLHRFVDAA